MPIQVSTPQKKSNLEHEERDEYDVKANWELNEDNEESAENRCQEVKCLNLMRLLKIDMIKKHLLSYALPMAIASSSAAMIFQIMLHPAVGIVNKLTGLDINWLNDPNTALICVAILTAWLNSGINFLYFSAGLGNIDETIYERASVDGASSMQQFFSLTLPGLSPIMFYTLVVNIIQAFQSFGQIKILTEGGPNESTNVIVYSIYRDAFFNYRFGSAAAQSVILFVIIMIITLIMFRIEKKGVNY